MSVPAIDAAARGVRVGDDHTGSDLLAILDSPIEHIVRTDLVALLRGELPSASPYLTSLQGVSEA